MNQVLQQIELFVQTHDAIDVGLAVLTFATVFYTRYRQEKARTHFDPAWDARHAKTLQDSRDLLSSIESPTRP